MRRRQRKKEARPSELDRWLAACDEMLEGMIESAGWQWATRRALGEIFVNIAHRVLVSLEQPTIH